MTEHPIPKSAEAPAQLTAALADRYALEREIGSGGMATVYLARDLRYGRAVAVKVLKPDLAAAVGADRFLREIRITAGLNHPYILPLLDSGEADGFLYYVMPFVEGGSLRKVVGDARPVSVRDVARIVEQVAAALDHAHRHGVVHRDVKPENILFSEGHPIVADFGIARVASEISRDQLTRSGVSLGTPGYMSPEQAAGRMALDARSDEFSLACVAYEMLVGETPDLWPSTDDVRLGRFQDARDAHRQRLDALPGRVEQALVRALALRPHDRFATPGEFATALAAASEGTSAIGDERMREVLRRAAELDAVAPDEHAFTLGGVEQVAAQVGIPPERVREALRDVERGTSAVPMAPRELESTVPALRDGRLVADRTAAGNLPESACETLVDEIQQTLGFVGSVSSVGRTLMWSGTKPGFVGRDVRVTVTRGPGNTRIHVEEHIELRGISIAAPAWGAAGGVLGTLGIVLALGLPQEVAVIAAIPMAVVGSILVARGVIRRLARKYWPQLRDLANALEAHAERLALPPGREDDAPNR